jgi:pimeloyl-ACP methyl ester carboxylesterase
MSGPDGIGEAPVFVLVHGAFHGGWCWRRVSGRLCAAGSRVHAPTMTGLGDRAHLLTRAVGLRTFVNDVLGMLLAEEIENAILVGHSFGGVVISGVADLRPDLIRRLIYLDAVVPIGGLSALDLLPADIAQARCRAAVESSDGLAIPVPPAAAFDVPPGPDRDWLDRRLTPHPFAAYADPVMLAHPVGNFRPKTYIRCTNPVYRAVEPSYARIEAEAGWTLRDLPAGHDAMITAPGPLAELLLDIAKGGDDARVT